jgi:uncharacterized membrane protein
MGRPTSCRWPGFRLFTVGTVAGMTSTCGRHERQRDTKVEAARRPRAPGILIGIGLGGFVDGIVLHQILQWHHLLSSEGAYPDTNVGGLKDNTLADGLFHAATWIAVAVGIWLLWRRTTNWRWATSGRALFGWILVGWGLFNLVEGLVNHHALGLHHVRESAGHQAAYDVGFLALSAVILLGGWLLARSSERDVSSRLTGLAAGSVLGDP